MHKGAKDGFPTVIVCVSVKASVVIVVGVEVGLKYCTKVRLFVALSPSVKLSSLTVFLRWDVTLCLPFLTLSICLGCLELPKDVFSQLYKARLAWNTCKWSHDFTVLSWTHIHTYSDKVQVSSTCCFAQCFPFYVFNACLTNNTVILQRK